jgi:Mg-chelatase subunit ChlD
MSQFLGLDTYLDSTSVQTAINKTTYTSGGTYIASGMNMALEQEFVTPGDRPTIPNIMIVITDGQDSSNVQGAQQIAASRNITVFSVGVGSNVDSKQLAAISGSTDRAFNATTFDFLDPVLKQICGNIGKMVIKIKGPVQQKNRFSGNKPII